MALTEKQLKVMKSEAMVELKSIRLDLHYSIDVLIDYRTDLKTEVADITKGITKASRKLRAIECKITDNGGVLTKLKRG